MHKIPTICIVTILALAIGVFIASLVERSRLEKAAPAGWRQLRAGMSAQQVEALLGAPDSVSFFLPAALPTVPPASEEWYYSFRDTETHPQQERFVVSFVTGRVDRFRVK